MGDKRKLTGHEYKILISEVKLRPCLWNDKHSDFKNRELTKKLWKEVGNAINLSGEDCKTKWKNLKDTFRKKIQNPAATTQSGFIRKNWRYLSLMEFAREAIFPNSTAGDLQTIEKEVTASNCHSVDRFSQFSMFSPGPDGNANIYIPYLSFKGSKKEENIENRMEVEEENGSANSQSVNENDIDDRGERNFLLSLLPFLSRLDNLEKLQLRGKIISCVTEAIREHEFKEARHQ